MTARMRRADVETRYRPACVNVKMHTWWSDVELPLTLGSVREADETESREIRTEPEFTQAWISEHVGDDEAWEWQQMTAADQWEWLTQEAQEIFGAHVKVYSEGRSGGWAVVQGLPDVDEWDAVMVAKWGRFARIARAMADDVARQAVESIYANRFEPLREAREQAVAALDVPDWTVATRAARELAAS